MRMLPLGECLIAKLLHGHYHKTSQLIGNISRFDTVSSIIK